MSSKEPKLRHVDYLKHMLEAIQLARTYTEGLNKDDFIEDKRTQQAVILNLLTIGEAAAHIAKEYPDFIGQHPSLPWNQMRGMRNRMAHGYFEINIDIVWDTIQQSLPKLEQQILDILDTISTSH